ncbi:hypothetical protein [Buttiauxella sp. S19-1]|uniref:hypothetical protein n=1 Tax=Buttiauxella sp. S19-1 TaxID=941430 RepID=UPI001EDAEF03|nr:hypothetical protein [Buttiauxella sp. S19-1]
MKNFKHWLTLFLIIFTCYSVHATTWSYLATSPSEDKAYSLPASEIESLPMAWFKTTNGHGQTLSISKDLIDCNKGRYTIKEVNKYSITGQMLISDVFTFNHWNEITPD